MAEFPALPLWTDAYLADCGHLSDEEHGRYFLLLMAMWRAPECRLPNDDEWLARRFRRTVADIVSQFRPLIAEFCQTTGNWITQKRLAREHAYVRARGKKQSDAAKSRWEKEKGACHGNAPTPTPTPTVSEGDKSPSAGTDFDPEKPVFDYGKQILGQSAGGQVRTLIRCHDGDLNATMATLRLAARKQDPREYVGAIVRGHRQPETDWDAEYRRMGVS